MKKVITFCSAVSASLIALLLISFLKGDSLDGAASIWKKLSLGWPVAWEMMSSILNGRWAFLVYGILIAFFSNKIMKSDMFQNNQPSGKDILFQIGSEASDLVNQLSNYERSNSELIGMGPLEYNRLVLFYEHVFDNLRKADILQHNEISFEEAVKVRFAEVNEYLAKVSIYCQNNNLEKAKSVAFPESFRGNILSF